MAINDPFDLYRLQAGLNSIASGMRIFQHLIDASPVEVADPGDAGAIPVAARDGYCYLVIGAGAEARTLADPTLDGQRMVISITSIGGGSCTLNVANAFNDAGDTQAVWGAADTNGVVIFEARRIGGSLRWYSASSDAVVLGGP